MGVTASRPAKRVLIVEDDVLLAYDLEDLVREAGYEPVGPAHSLSEGLELAGAGVVDAALLDIDLGREKVWPLAELLHARGTPLAFVSAQCTLVERPAALKASACLAKPARAEAIFSLLDGLCNARVAASH